MLSKILKGKIINLIPVKIKNTLSFYRNRIKFKRAYFFDLDRYYRFSESKEEKSKENLIGLVIRRYHSVEKGLTMSGSRLGFGQAVVTALVKDCRSYVTRFGIDDDQLIQAFSVILEYRDYHSNAGFQLESATEESLSQIEEYRSILGESGEFVMHQKQHAKEEYFSRSNDNFHNFSISRSSLRSYSDEEVELSRIEKALELARFAPSACNRQSWRTYVFTNKKRIDKILALQGGNRGFGHLANKLVLITSEIGVFAGVAERNQAFIDGGIYAMNLLYGLHYYKVGACILNCSNTVEKDLKLRELCQVKDSEVFIAFISCGNPPNEFKSAASIRYKLEKTNNIIRD